MSLPVRKGIDSRADSGKRLATLTFTPVTLAAVTRSTVIANTGYETAATVKASSLPTGFGNGQSLDFPSVSAQFLNEIGRFGIRFQI